jgi:hypothetical protein
MVSICFFLQGHSSRFGVLLLFRGLGFSLVIVIFTDLQRAEITSVAWRREVAAGLCSR